MVHWHSVLCEWKGIALTSEQKALLESISAEKTVIPYAYVCSRYDRSINEALAESLREFRFIIPAWIEDLK